MYRDVLAPAFDKQVKMYILQALTHIPTQITIYFYRKFNLKSLQSNLKRNITQLHINLKDAKLLKLREIAEGTELKTFHI